MSSQAEVRSSTSVRVMASDTVLCLVQRYGMGDLSRADHGSRPCNYGPAVWFSSRRASDTRRCAPSRLGIRRVSAGDAIFWTALADTFWDVTCGLSIFRSTGASIGVVLTGDVMAREAGRSTRSTAGGSRSGRTVLSRRWRADAVRFFRRAGVDADGVLRHTFAAHRGSEMVDRDWHFHWFRTDVEVQHRISGCGPARRNGVDRRAALLPKQMALVRSRDGAPDVSAEHNLAGAAWVHLTRLPEAHTRARHPHWTDKKLPA